MNSPDTVPHNLPPSQHYPQYVQDDEIDLFELAEKLWARKLTIVAITGIISLIALAAALLWPPTWQGEARIYAPEPMVLAPLHQLQDQLGIGKTSTNAAFQDYYRFLTSPETQRTVFNQSSLAEQAAKSGTDQSIEAGFAAFNESLTIERSDPEEDHGNYLTVTFNANNPALATSLINDLLLPTAHQRAVEAMIGNLTSHIALRRDHLNRQIAKIEREFIDHNAISRFDLRHSLETAQAGKITTLATDRFKEIHPNNRFLLGTSILNQLLEQQIQDIEQHRLYSRPREGDQDRPLLAPVIPLALELETLNSTTPNLDNLKLVTIDPSAALPFAPIKPKKSLIVALGVVLGGMLGVFVALIQIACASRREKLELRRLQGDTLSPLSQADTLPR